MALPGDRIWLRAGSYTGGVNIFVPNLTISSYDPERAVITAPVSSSDIGSAIRFTGGNDGGAAQITLRRLHVRGGFYYAIMFDSAGGGTSNMYWNFLLSVSGIRSPPITLIDDCVLSGAGVSVVKLSPQANDVVFNNCELFFSGQRAAQQSSATAPKAGAGGNETIAPPPVLEEPVPAGFGGYGIDNRGSDRLVVRGCYIHEVGTAIILGLA